VRLRFLNNLGTGHLLDNPEARLSMRIFSGSPFRWLLMLLTAILGAAESLRARQAVLIPISTRSFNKLVKSFATVLN